LVQETEGQPTWGDLILQKMFGGFEKWDAVYFLKIAEEGYTYEQYMAFFPLYPWILRTLARMFHLPVQYFISHRSALFICGWLLNTVCFTLAAVSLYKLTCKLFGRDKVALVSSLLFCINPASVFMSSLYTESLFSCLQFTALYFLEQTKSILACLLFGLGCATRSNGIISCGFVTHSILKHCLSNGLTLSSHLKLADLFYALTVLLKVIVLNGIVLAPFILFQLYGYSLYCTPLARDMTNQKLAWCDRWLPFPYSYIQDTYWHVGFLRYFELKQIPNFLLAAPVIVLSSCAVLTYCYNQKNFETVKTLGLWQDIKYKHENMARRSIHCSSGRIERQDIEFYHSPPVFVYVVHLAFMTLFGFTSMHVQVITRFIASASPLIYWYSAHVIIRDTADPGHRYCRSKWRSQLILGYFILYFFIGTALHCNFYPWT